MNKNLQNYEDMLDRFQHYLDKSYVMAETFGGPSIYFHEKALEWCEKEFLGERHLEYVYATLVSWGMHRMGEKGAKMPDFDTFKKSILDVKEKLFMWKDLKIEQLSEQELDALLPKLTDVCFSINASISDSHVVSSSKTLAHILPNLVCPMDRHYTLDFFNMSLGNEEKEHKFFQFVMRQMWEFYQDKHHLKSIKLGDSFCKSYPKVFDNLIIAYMKEHPQA